MMTNHAAGAATRTPDGRQNARRLRRRQRPSSSQPPEPASWSNSQPLIGQGLQKYGLHRLSPLCALCSAPLPAASQRSLRPASRSLVTPARRYCLGFSPLTPTRLVTPTRLESSRGSYVIPRECRRGANRNIFCSLITSAYSAASWLRKSLPYEQRLPSDGAPGKCHNIADIDANPEAHPSPFRFAVVGSLKGRFGSRSRSESRRGCWRIRRALSPAVFAILDVGR